MAWDKFVYDNIKKQLMTEGFSEALAQGGAAHGADLYRRKSQASRKGMIYDDCLTLARQFVIASCTKEEKPAKSGKKKSRTVAAVRPSLI